MYTSLDDELHVYGTAQFQLDAREHQSRVNSFFFVCTLLKLACLIRSTPGNPLVTLEMREIVGN